jgi:hypothetical protein
MQISPLQGKLDQSGFFIYAAADAVYFDQYGIPLINSVTRNTPHGVHVHLYNPRPDQIAFCQQHDRVSITWETVTEQQFQPAFDFWKQDTLPDPYMGRKRKMLGLKQYELKGNDLESLNTWLWKTYYACMRFVRMAEIIQKPTRFLEIDVDGLVRAPFEYMLPTDSKTDVYLYEKAKGGHLAGAMLFTERPNGVKFIHELGNMIRAEIEKDNIYWFLDQHSLDNIIGKYRKGMLPLTYIDWHMSPTSAIWSAKGKRKHLEIFVQELKKYQ